ncbi:phage virion morphogenesis protein, partial [Pseudomonas aeruginosa]|nr:phage virion morphogenesis protein [Pseudomonas aeruginosa]
SYAAIQQLGGQAGRGRKVTIPARPYLPVLRNGQLKPSARDAVLDVLLAVLSQGR